MSVQSLRKLYLILVLMTPLLPGHAQEPAGPEPRPPAVAGSFYAGDPSDLRHDLDFLFSRALPSRTEGKVLAVIAPHAGYPYSGEVAASAYAQVDPDKDYKNIFILGRSHNYSYEGASIFRSGNFLTPLGEVRVNTTLAGKLQRQHDVFTDDENAHLREHSLEVQLPFLQHYLEKDFQIVPILLGSGSKSMCRDLAGALKPYLNDENLFVISSDFSHYPDYRSARSVDLNTAHAICTNLPGRFLSALEQNEQKEIPNLLTSACAWPAILTLMYMTQDFSGQLDYELIQYRNSGDAEIGDKSRVVGYCAIAVSLKDPGHEAGFTLSDKDKTVLLEIARTSLESYIREGIIPQLEKQAYSPSLQAPGGAFVTLKKNSRLRGCIGLFQSGQPLCEVVRDMTISAATKDIRFQPVRTEELDEIELEISVLSPFVRIHDPSEIKLGHHGIYIKKGTNSGTFLPQVATETGWDLEEFLGHCAMDKARIGWYGWKSAEIYTYEALVFMEKDFQTKAEECLTH